MPPTSTDYAQLLGAILFSIGSACFVWMSWVDDWVLPFQLGCAFWIGGCVALLWPPLRNEYLKLGKHVSNALQILGSLGWGIGSAFGFHDDLDFGLIITNAGYLGGSICFLLDALVQGRTFFSEEPQEALSIVADVLAGLFYTLAGAFGGYATTDELLRFGNACWLVGSLVSGVRPCLALRSGCGSATHAADADAAGGTRSIDPKKDVEVVVSP